MINTTTTYVGVWAGKNQRILPLQIKRHGSDESIMIQEPGSDFKPVTAYQVKSGDIVLKPALTGRIDYKISPDNWIRALQYLGSIYNLSKWTQKLQL